MDQDKLAQYTLLSAENLWKGFCLGLGFWAANWIVYEVLFRT